LGFTLRVGLAFRKDEKPFDRLIGAGADREPKELRGAPRWIPVKPVAGDPTPPAERSMPEKPRPPLTELPELPEPVNDRAPEKLLPEGAGALNERVPDAPKLLPEGAGALNDRVAPEPKPRDGCTARFDPNDGEDCTRDGAGALNDRVAPEPKL
jgi:hypothetical protein